MKKKPTKKTITIIFFMTIGMYLGSLVPANLMRAETNSVGYRLFFYNQNQTAPQISKNDFVVFTLDLNMDGEKKPYRLVKKAACVGGEKLETDKDGFYYCNGEYLGKYQLLTPSGKKTEPFIFNGIIPENNFFAFGGGNIYSYDSRYFGFIKNEIVEGVAIPLF